jgi:HK97 family phage major capsid protein
MKPTTRRLAQKMKNYLTKSDKNQRDLGLNVTDSKIDVENRTVELSFSSNAPYERWEGVTESLNHTDESMDLTRLNAKGALLLNHNWGKQIGCIERAYIQGDQGRAVVKFSQRQEAQDYFQDIQDGIIANVSVGYSVNEIEYNEKTKNVDVTKWQPYEISLVSVPADFSVGVGRSINENENDNETINLTTKKEKNMTDKKMETFADGIKQERERIRSIEQLATEFKEHDFARSYTEKDVAFDVFQKDLMLHVQSKQKERMQKLEAESPTVRAAKSSPNLVGLTDKETRNFSISKALRALSNPMDSGAREAAAFEFEASQEAKRGLGVNDNSFMIPTDILQRDFTVAGGGAATVGTELRASSFIDLLRNKSAVMNHAQRLSGLRGNISIPRQEDTSSHFWVGEGESVGQGNITTDQITLSPKRLGAYLNLSQELILNSSLDAESMVRNDLLSSIALGIDTAAIYGTGADKQPLGLTKASGVAVNTFAGDAPTMADYIAAETGVALNNADVANMLYLMGPALRGAAKSTPKFASTTDATIWEPGNTINGYNVDVSNQIQANQVIFGDFSQLLIGFWDGLRLIVDPYTGATSGTTRIVAMQNIDVAVRRPESFSILNKA